MRSHAQGMEEFEALDKGSWSELPLGGHVWRLRIVSPGASSHNLVFRSAHSTMLCTQCSKAQCIHQLLGKHFFTPAFEPSTWIQWHVLGSISGGASCHQEALAVSRIPEPPVKWQLAVQWLTFVPSVCAAISGYQRVGSCTSSHQGQCSGIALVSGIACAWERLMSRTVTS